MSSRVRDSMRYVPNPINSMIYDYALDLSLGGDIKSWYASDHVIIYWD